MAVPDHSHKEIAAVFNARFSDSPITLAQVKSYIKNNRLNTGRTGRFVKGCKTWNKGLHYTAGGRSAETRFKPGRRPHTYKPIGTETWRSDGYLWRKVADTKPSRFGWRQVHRILWEEANGPIPKDRNVVFKDGDRTNITLDNLMLVSRAQHGVMAKLGLHGGGEAGRTAADLIMTVTARKRGTGHEG
jgi:hypothetical protein